MKSRPVHKPVSKVLTSRTLLVFVEMFPSTFKLQLSPIISSTTSYTHRENKASNSEYSMTGKTGTRRGKSWREAKVGERLVRERWERDNNGTAMKSRGKIARRGNICEWEI